MDKIIQPWGISDDSEFPGLFRVVTPDEARYSREKVASCGIHPDIMHFVDTEIGTTHPLNDQYVYIIASNMGAGETWGSNVNADRFLRSELSYVGRDWGIETFKDAGIFKHHVNKDKKKSYGDIIAVTFAPAPIYLDRVESVVRLDRERAARVGAEDVIRRIESGEFPAWSMGAKVKYDVCSYCGNKARTRKEYCVHMLRYPNVILTANHLDNRDFKGMSTDKVGLRICVDNPRPRFFDFSQVWVGAAAEAKTLRKIASASTVLSADLYDELAKAAEMRKQVPGEVPDSPDGKALRVLSKSEKPIPNEILNSLGGLGLAKALSTTTGMGMILRPREFQRITLVAGGRKGFADQLDSVGSVFTPNLECDRDVHKQVAYKNFVRGAAHMLLSMVNERSAYTPLVRVRMHKYVHNPVRTEVVREVRSPDLDKIAGLYNGYRLTVLEKLSGIGTQVLMQDPVVRDAVYGDSIESMMSGISKQAEPVVGRPTVLYALHAHDLNVPELQKYSGFASAVLARAARVLS